MPVSGGFRDFVVEQLEQVTRRLQTRRMFGGIGIYGDELFFALIDDDRLYFKVDDATRGTFVTAGMAAFQPNGPESGAMNYYEVPIAVLEDVDLLRTWVADALDVARRAALRKRRGT